MAAEFISLQEAAAILQRELNYPADRALHYAQSFDRNKDGRLSRSEFQAFKAKIEETKKNLIPRFKEYDVDGNGYITLEEATQILQHPPFNFPAGKVVMLLKQFDTDGNGKLDIEEFADFYAEARAQHVNIAAKFDELDRDCNGVLSPDEVVSLIRDKMGFDANMAKYMVQMFDQNQDGSLDKAEFVTMWTSMFG